MDEQASFETRAVLPPRRSLMSRLALLVPVVAFVAIAGAGLSGPSSDRTASASSPDPTTVATTTLPWLPVEVAHPVEVLGIEVQRLGELQIGSLGFETVVAIAGWYVPTAVTDCPALAALYRDGALPYVRGDRDKLAFCVRSGMLYPSSPDHPNFAPTGVAVTVIAGVLMPREVEVVGTHATQVVFLGRFGKSSDGCRDGGTCQRELLVDHVAWTPDV
jgi:hypothetical protein